MVIFRIKSVPKWSSFRFTSYLAIAQPDWSIKSESEIIK